MPISGYNNGTASTTNGSLEIAGDGIGPTLTQVGEVVIIQLRAPAGQSNTEPFQLIAAPDCECSINGTTWATSVTVPIGHVTAINTPTYHRRIGSEFITTESSQYGARTEPRAALIATA